MELISHTNTSTTIVHRFNTPRLAVRSVHSLHQALRYMPTQEDKARENIDLLLTKAGWAVCDKSTTNVTAYRKVIIQNFNLKPGHGFADYLLNADGGAAGVVEAKKEGVTLTGVETQSDKYTKGLPDG